MNVDVFQAFAYIDAASDVGEVFVRPPTVFCNDLPVRFLERLHVAEYMVLTVNRVDLGEDLKGRYTRRHRFDGTRDSHFHHLNLPLHRHLHGTTAVVDSNQVRGVMIWCRVV